MIGRSPSSMSISSTDSHDSCGLPVTHGRTASWSSSQTSASQVCMACNTSLLEISSNYDEVIIIIIILIMSFMTCVLLSLANAREMALHPTLPARKIRLGQACNARARPRHNPGVSNRTFGNRTQSNKSNDWVRLGWQSN